MLSKIRSFFGFDGNLSDKEFQQRVCSVCRRSFPEYKVVALADPLRIEVSDTKIGIFNLRSKFNVSSRTDEDLRHLVEETVSAALVGAKQAMDVVDLSWEAARTVLMPQLVNDGMTSAVPVLSIPFCGEVQIAFVLDSERTFRYVTEEMFETWDVNIKEVMDLAINNLEQRSGDLEATSVPGSLLAIKTNDSFDAVRILSPAIRRAILESVGSPFCFGVPNRDFLVCWPKTDVMTAIWGPQVKIDFEEQPYAISGNVFECDENGEVSKVKTTQ